MPFTIYKATDPEGRSYIGCTCQSAEVRWATREIIGGPESVAAAIRKFGRYAFTLTALAVVESESDAAEVERLMMRLHSTLRPDGYNSLKTAPYSNWHLRAA